MATVQFLISASVIIVSAVALTRFADAIAHHTRLGRLWVGTVFLAAATSIPELSVDVSAVWQGLPDVAVGDLLGSSLFNLLILGVADLTGYSRGRLLSHQSRAHALSGVLSMALMALAALGIALGGHFVLGRVGLGSACILITYLLGMRMVYADQRCSAAKGSAPEACLPRNAAPSLAAAFLGYVVTTPAIVVAGPFLAEAAGELSEVTGLGETFVGTTLVALSTSLPEAVTTLTALRLRAFDLALGNIFGSNSVNMALLFAVDAVFPTPLLAAVSSAHLLTCLAAILATCVVVAGQLYRSTERQRIVEPDALVVILLVVAALVGVYWLGVEPR